MNFYETKNVPSFIDNVDAVQDEDVMIDVYKAAMKTIEQNGVCNTTVRVATMYDRKGYTTFTETGKPRNPGYSNEDDAFVVQLSVMIQSFDEGFHDMLNVEQDLKEIRENKVLAEKKQRLDEARLAFEKAQNEFENAKNAL